MPHKHIVYDADPHFTIDPDTRVLQYTSPEKLTIMQGDHNSEIFTFDMPREVDGHDMSKCNKVQVHYINIDANKSSNRSPGIYEVTDLQLKEGDENTLVFSWLVSRNATQYAGPLNFIIRFACTTETKDTNGNTVAEVDYTWNTAIFQGVAVANSLDNSEDVIEGYADILMNWYYDLVNAGTDGVNKVEAVVEAALDRVNNIGVLTSELGHDAARPISQKGVTKALGELAFSEYAGPYSEGLNINVYDNYNVLSDTWEKIAVVEGRGTCTDSDIAIPPSYNGYPVAYVTHGAFFFNSAPDDHYVSIRFPSTIRFESRDTQYGGPISASNLTEMISIPDNVQDEIWELTIFIEHKREVPAYFWNNPYYFTTTFVFGPDIERIYSNAFNNIAGTDEYDFSKATTIPEIEQDSLGYIGTGFDNYKPITVPEHLYEGWIAAPIWRNFAEYTRSVKATNKVLNTDDIVNELGADKAKPASQDLVNAVVDAVTSKSTERGSVVRLNGLLPIQQHIGVKLQSKNLWQVTTPSGNVSYEADEQVLVINGPANLTLHKLSSPIPKGTTVTITAQVLSGTVTSAGDGGLAFGGYHKAGSVTSWQGYINVPKRTNLDISGQTFTQTATVTEDVTHFYIFVYASTATIHSPLRVKVQYEISDTATEMVPYVDPSTAKLMVARRNLIKFPYAESDRTRAGISYTTDSNGVITYTGTSTGSYLSLATFEGKEVYLHKGVMYAFTGIPSGTSMSTSYAHITEADDSTRHYIYNDGASSYGGLTFYAQTSGYAKVTLVVSEGTTVNKKQFVPMLEAIDYNPDFEPYEGQTHTPDNGSCDVLSTPPTMTLTTDTPNVVVEVTHNQDINSVLKDIRATLDLIMSKLE